MQVLTHNLFFIIIHGFTTLILEIYILTIFTSIIFRICEINIGEKRRNEAAKELKALKDSNSETGWDLMLTISDDKETKQRRSVSDTSLITDLKRFSKNKAIFRIKPSFIDDSEERKLKFNK